SPATACFRTRRIVAAASRRRCSPSWVSEGASHAREAHGAPGAGRQPRMAARRPCPDACGGHADRVRARHGVLRLRGAGLAVVSQRGLLLRASAALAVAGGHSAVRRRTHRLPSAATTRLAAWAAERGPAHPGAPSALRRRGEWRPTLAAARTVADAARGVGEGRGHHLHGPLAGAPPRPLELAGKRR